MFKTQVPEVTPPTIVPTWNDPFTTPALVIVTVGLWAADAEEEFLLVVRVCPAESGSDFLLSFGVLSWELAAE